MQKQIKQIGKRCARIQLMKFTMMKLGLQINTIARTGRAEAEQIGSTTQARVPEVELSSERGDTQMKDSEQ